MFPNVMSSTDQCLRIEINIKPARKPEIQLLREFLVSFNLCSLKKNPKNKPDVYL